jgi:hypothetical protein
MGRKPRIKTHSSIALGQHLALLRRERKMSLREVQANTDGMVDDAYLSQIENGWVQFPHPLILRRLAKVYLADYRQILLVAFPDEEGTGKHRDMFKLEGLAKEEMLACQAYLQQFRIAAGRAGKSG